MVDFMKRKKNNKNIKSVILFFSSSLLSYGLLEVVFAHDLDEKVEGHPHSRNLLASAELIARLLVHEPSVLNQALPPLF